MDFGNKILDFVLMFYLVVMTLGLTHGIVVYASKKNYIIVGGYILDITIYLLIMYKLYTNSFWI